MTRTKRSGALAAIAGAVVLAASLLALTALTKPAEAAFPGNNGKIVFASDRYTFFNPEGDLEIYTMNPNGTEQTQLTFNAADDSSPTYAPNGKKIAFSSYRDGNVEVYTMNADGSGQTNRSQNPYDDSSPAWSANGKNQTRLTNNAASDEAPDWQPL